MWIDEFFLLPFPTSTPQNMKRHHVGVHRMQDYKQQHNPILSHRHLCKHRTNIWHYDRFHVVHTVDFGTCTLTSILHLSVNIVSRYRTRPCFQIQFTVVHRTFAEITKLFWRKARVKLRQRQPFPVTQRWSKTFQVPNENCHWSFRKCNYIACSIS